MWTDSRVSRGGECCSRSRSKNNRNSSYSTLLLSISITSLNTQPPRTNGVTAWTFYSDMVHASCTSGPQMSQLIFAANFYTALDLRAGPASMLRADLGPCMRRSLPNINIRLSPTLCTECSRCVQDHARSLI